MTVFRPKSSPVSVPVPSKPVAAPKPAVASKPAAAPAPQTRTGVAGFRHDELSSGRGGALRRNAAALLGGGYAPQTVKPTETPALFKGGGGCRRYDPRDEFGLALHRTQQAFGNAAAASLEATLTAMRNGTPIDVSTRAPQVGDIMVWNPNAGDPNSMVGAADGAGHVGVVHSVTQNADGTVTVRVLEQNWNPSDGTIDGVPYRDLRLSVNADGTLALPDGTPLPDGVGFIHTNPAVPQQLPATGSSDGSGGGEVSPVADHSDVQLPSVSINRNDGYTGCIGYIHDRGDFRELFPAGAIVNGRDIPRNTLVPQEGALMSWGAGASDGNFTAGSQGHVAYVERVTPNYENGVLVSYTITVSEGVDPDLQDPRLRTFTVPANADGTIDVDGDVGFYVGSGGGSSPTVGSTSTGGAISSGTYTVVSGDTLTSIASRAGVSLADLIAANPGINPDVLSIGQRINVP